MICSLRSSIAFLLKYITVIIFIFYYKDLQSLYTHLIIHFKALSHHLLDYNISPASIGNKLYIQLEDFWIKATLWLE